MSKPRGAMGSPYGEGAQDDMKDHVEKMASVMTRDNTSPQIKQEPGPETPATLTFLVVERQAADGCDHSIGCGLKVYGIQAKSITEVKQSWIDKEILCDGPAEIEGHLEGRLGDKSEFKRESIQIYGISSIVSLDLKALKNEIREKYLKKESEDEKKEREEYERLKKKFEK